ncbi:ABC transporter permease [Marinivivus vitaminiproducens]|uniref:ABC transporter permease n=1 Tax=Marinivivus vitaminiproducens TaxID=3035935 RepID=UPI00279D30D6|nr:ABC transporter permease [Geminicoccaceae bacterium SCSIO 64248]
MSSPTEGRTAPRLRRRTAASWLLVLPALAIIGLFMLAPLGLMFEVSFLEKGAQGGVRWGTFTPEAYVAFVFERDLDDSLLLNLDYVRIFARSFVLAFATMTIALLIGFPVALHMALQTQARRNLLIFLVTIPFWTNLLVRNYAWILFLRNNGLLDGVLHALGLTDAPIGILYTPTAVMIGLVYSYLPFMVLPIYASLEKLDFRLVEAAYDLGANRWRALWRVIVPLATPGIAAGCILVLIPCLGAYVTPELLGGSRSLMIGNLISGQFGQARNWPLGAAFAFVLLTVVLIAMVAYLVRFRQPPETA